jgi:hypothetical protein
MIRVRQISAGLQTPMVSMSQSVIGSEAEKARVMFILHSILARVTSHKTSEESRASEMCPPSLLAMGTRKRIVGMTIIDIPVLAVISTKRKRTPPGTHHSKEKRIFCECRDSSVESSEI